MVADSKKKIILYCHNDYYKKNGGEYNVFNNDVKLLEKMGYKIIRYEKNNDEIYNSNFLKKIWIILNSFFNTKTYREVKAIIENEKIDLAFVQNTFLIISPAIYLTLFKYKIPVIQMIYNYRLICPNAHLYTNSNICEKCIKGNYFNAVRNKCIKNNYLISLWYAFIIIYMNKFLQLPAKIDAFIVPDLFSLNKHNEGGISKSKIFIAKNPFTASEKLNISHDLGYFLFVGRLIKQKGIFTYLEAARQLPDIEFKIVGEGEEEKNVKDFIMLNNIKNVEYIGPIYGNELNKIIQLSRTVVVPSEWYDNYPVVIALAYNYSKPVIATNINGLPEVVINNKTGLLFELKNVEDLCRKIKDLAYNIDKAKELGKNARLFLETELNEEKRIKTYKRILSYVAKK